ncbi:Amino acid transporters [Ceraceosorus bombacis]|uniref:Amino acid transporters n=1 Tax=Ceraceosorus bombacis TaxID=401625 RepID=A0A0P1BL29_9BASI|nr:Amino acid transporters [Ceraceosorus bombacis]
MSARLSAQAGGAQGSSSNRGRVSAGPSGAQGGPGGRSGGPASNVNASGSTRPSPHPTAPRRVVPRTTQQQQQQQQRENAANAGAPWRSSLDLVWSYSRSQAFFGDNIATEPSFVDRRWAGPALGTEGQDSSELASDTGDETYSDYEEELEDEDGLEGEFSNDVGVTLPGQMEWEEPLPPNAVGRRRSATPIEGPAARHARNWRLSSLAREEDEDEERSRSRSRSPKRIEASAPQRRGRVGGGSSRFRNSDSSQFTEAEMSSGSELQNGRGAGMRGAQSRSAQAQHTESTPLLSTSPTESIPRRKSSALSASGARRTSYASKTASGLSHRSFQENAGSSTFWQSWFNTVNALVGIGILALPLALSYAGWIPGIILFLLCGLLTNYTGKILANIMSRDVSLRTYADIGAYAFGPSARVWVSGFFCLELWAVGTALVILFGDSTYALVQASAKGYRIDSPAANAELLYTLGGISTWSPTAFKALGLVIALPTVFLPLRLLSPISVVGIVSILTLFAVVLSDGLIKKERPGSLWDPAVTSLWPEWSRLPLSFGLIMSGFSAHPIIPSISKDMKDPAVFGKMLDLAYIAATLIYLAMGIVGYLLFGHEVSSEITQDLSRTAGYPRVLNKIAIWMMVVSALSKFALAVRPLNTTVELLAGVEQSLCLPFKSPSGINRRRASVAKLDSERGRAGLGAHSQFGLGGDDIEPRLDLSKAEPPAAAKATSLGANPAAEDPDSGSITPIADPETGTTLPNLSSDNPLAGSAISLRAARTTSTWTPRTRALLRASLRVGVALLVGLTAILLPGFEKVMAFLGAFLAFSTCVFGPVLANMKVNFSSMSRRRITLDIFILAISLVLAVTGTVWAFLPVATKLHLAI